MKITYTEIKRRILNRLKRCWYCYTKIVSHSWDDDFIITQHSNGGIAGIIGVGGAYVCISCLLKENE